ncbi:hypothetical protein DRN89_03465, partial [archaeon]
RKLTTEIEKGEGGKVARREQRRILVRFLKKYPKIIASNGRSYGPFKEEDLAYLPSLDVRFLKDRKIVEEIQ